MSNKWVFCFLSEKKEYSAQAFLLILIWKGDVAGALRSNSIDETAITEYLPQTAPLLSGSANGAQEFYENMENQFLKGVSVDGRREFFKIKTNEELSKTAEYRNWASRHSKGVRKIAARSKRVFSSR